MELTRAEIRRRFQDADGYTPQAVTGLVERTARAMAQGEFMRVNPRLAVQARSLPVDPWLRAGDPRFRYTALVTHVGADGTRVSYIVPVLSDTALSGEQLEERVRAQYVYGCTSRASTARAIAQLEAQRIGSVTALTAGVRGS